MTVVPLSRFCLEPVADRGLVLGFSGVRVEEIAKGVGVLAEVLG